MINQELENIIQILMRRDQISYSEACRTVNNCIEELHEAQTLEECEDAVVYWLGLEPDYLDVLLSV